MLALLVRRIKFVSLHTDMQIQIILTSTRVLSLLSLSFDVFVFTMSLQQLKEYYDLIYEDFYVRYLKIHLLQFLSYNI